MPRKPDERIEQAKEMYLKGQKLVEIASQLNLPEGTIRRWKCTCKWDSERSDKKNERSDKDGDRKKEEKRTAAEEAGSVIKNTKLTDKQRAFCIYYTRCFNATKAYQKAYGVSYETAAAISYRMLENDGVKNEIQKLKQNRLNKEMLDEHDIFQRYMDIAFADITDYLEFGREQVPVMSMHGPVEIKDPETGEKKTLMKTVNAVRFKESAVVDGTIISEVKQGKDGASIKLADRMKALQWLSDHMNLATEEQRARIKLLNQKAKENDDGRKDAMNKLDEILNGIKQNAEAEQKTE